MCGIFGWSFKGHAGIGQGQREVMASVLAIANSTRGDQSWGLFARTGKNTRIVKEVGDICRASFASNGMIPLLMAHTRYSTHGKITKDNAHPHTAGSIVLCHNGVIFNHDEINKKYGRTCEVDSQHLAMHLAEGKPFDDLEGYGAIEWADMNHPDKIMLCRMSGGSLSVAGIKNAKGQRVAAIWSSDADHLMTALDTARVHSFEYARLEEGKVYEVSAGNLFDTKHPDLKLAERIYRADLTHWQGVTAGSQIVGSRFTDPDEDNWNKYVQAKALATELGLTEAGPDLWKSEEGVDVHTMDLIDMVEEDEEEKDKEKIRALLKASEAEIDVEVTAQPKLRLMH